jgi:eukaryotic-like serine/threonine-protein kinase
MIAVLAEGVSPSCVIWKAVRAEAGDLHFGHRRDRFNPQTQFDGCRGAPACVAAYHFSLKNVDPCAKRARGCGARSSIMATVETSRAAVRHESPAADGPQLLGRLGAWQLVRLLGEGTFTRVYATRPADGPQNAAAAYALKALRKEWWRDPQAIEMQRREAWVGTKVSHPNLLPALSASVQEPPFYVVTPKIEGQSLAQLIFQHERLPVPLALWIARQVADGLDALHEAAGVIHTDVKPANILVSATGHATLIDFGFVQTPAEANEWATRPLAGTLAYIAPEMVTSALAASPRSDIYSLGVTLYEMLTGRRPWESEDPGELAVLHREAKPGDLRTARPEVPVAVAELVHLMLAKDSLRRPGSASELSRRLVRLEIDCFSLRP